jgi:hypothetical protein
MSVIGRPRTWSDEQFVLSVATAKSWSGVAHSLGIKPTGKVYRRFRDLAEVLAVDITHLTPPRTPPTRRCKNCSKILPGRKRKVFCNSRCDMEHRRAVKLDAWLTTGKIDAAEPGIFIRQYLLEAQNHLCALCGMCDNWESKPLNFVLDHVDGSAQHNRRENLRLVCPNCDSQLPTYKGKNFGNGRHNRRVRYAAGKSYLPPRRPVRVG